MPYFKVHWVATVGESIVKAENEEKALAIANSRVGEEIVSEDWWDDDFHPCVESADELTPEEIKAYRISRERPTMKGQADYCKGCYYFEVGECNVILKEGEKCEDRVVFFEEEEKKKD